MPLPELRDAGNKLYQAKKFSQAIAKYTRSAQFAPPTSDALSLAFANRSAVLFQVMRLFLGCVTRLWAWGRVTQPMKSLHLIYLNEIFIEMHQIL